MATALILNADGAVGAYLARLLHARGTTVIATTGGGTGALAALGSRDDVNIVPGWEAVSLAATGDNTTVFAIDGEGQDTLIGDAIAAIGPTTRLLHVAGVGALRHRDTLRDRVAAIAALRREGGRFALNAILRAHDSRLGPVDNLAARVTIHAWQAAQGAVDPLELTETGPVDWGWTPEYVDAIARLATLERPLDFVIGSGVTLTTADFVRDAFAFFKLDPAGHVRMTPGDGVVAPPLDTDRLKIATGWTAHTTGRDLVRALCEGAATRALPADTPAAAG